MELPGSRIIATQEMFLNEFWVWHIGFQGPDMDRPLGGDAARVIYASELPEDRGLHLSLSTMYLS